MIGAIFPRFIIENSVSTKFPSSFRCLMGAKDVSLSTGFARALFHGAQCYILDEPTSALDKVTSAAIFEHFFALVNHVKLFVITHDIDILSRCSEVILIDNGTVQLISNPSKAKLADLIAKS